MPIREIRGPSPAFNLCHLPHLWLSSISFNEQRRTDFPIHCVLGRFSRSRSPVRVRDHNSLRRTSEQYHSFRRPNAVSTSFASRLTNSPKPTAFTPHHAETAPGSRIGPRRGCPLTTVPYATHAPFLARAHRRLPLRLQTFRPFMLTPCSSPHERDRRHVISSLTAYVFSRYRFPGHRLLFLITSLHDIPGVLTLVPSFSG